MSKLAAAVIKGKDLSQQIRQAGGRYGVQFDTSYSDALDEVTDAIEFPHYVEETASE